MSELTKIAMQSLKEAVQETLDEMDNMTPEQEEEFERWLIE